MIPKIETLDEIKLIGKRLSMTFAENKTHELWSSFMPLRNHIQNNVGSDLYSVQLYTTGFFEYFNPNAIFEKWAAVKVGGFGEIPAQMEAFTISGLYATFDYKGNPNDAQNIFQYIFNLWLPKSGYVLDGRLHFEILGEKYKNNDPNSEEKICIPIRLK